MARNLAYYMDPDEEERQRLLEQEFGPPAPPTHPSLGVAPVPRLPIDATTPRRTDGDYSDFHDPYQDEEPTEEELAADVAHEEGGYEQVAPASGERVAPPEEEHPLDVFLTDPGRAANPYEEEAQAYAKEQKQAAPRPVDDKAASVADEQKGVPAATKLATTIDTDDELAWADELLAGVKKRVIDKPEASEGALHQQAEQFASDSLAPQKSFSREELAARALSSYEDAPASRQWEDEFLRGRERFSDAEIRRRSALIGFFGEPEQGERWAAAQRDAQQNYDEGLGKARDRDKKNTRISRGLASAIAATGMVPPEEAGKLTYGDDLVKNFGQYASQGGRAEGQQAGLEKARMHEAFGLLKSDSVDDRTRGIAMLQSLTQLQQTQLRAEAFSAPVEETMAGAASMLEQAMHVPSGKGIGARALSGDLAGLSAEQKDIAARLGPQLIARARGKGGLSNVFDDSLKAQATQPIKDRYSIDKTLEIARSNPQQRTKFKNDWDSAAIAFRDGWGAWNSLPQEAKDRFSEWASGGFTGDIQKFLSSPEEQEKFAAVRGVVNALVKERSGSAVTGSEWERIASEIGLEADNWGPFNTSGSVTQWLRRTGKTLETHRDNFESEYGWEAPSGR